MNETRLTRSVKGAGFAAKLPPGDLDRTLCGLDLLFDPQTSGGLLIALAQDEAETLRQGLLARGIAAAALVGEVVTQPADKIIVDYQTEDER